MNRWGTLFFALLAAVPVHAAGITSFEPDTTTRPPRERREREPMTETPYWSGSSWSFGTEYLRAADRGALERLGTVEYALTATFPHRSHRQSWLEFSYGRWLLTSDFTSTILFPGETVPRPILFRSKYDIGIAMLRGGLEQRIGRRTRPWATAGAGVGLGAGGTKLAALDANARATLYAYPSDQTRIGLQLSGGPLWLSSDPRTFLPGEDRSPSSPVRRHYAAALRFERRMRYPQALGERSDPAAVSASLAQPVQTPIWIGVSLRTGTALLNPDRPFGSELTASRGFAVHGSWPWSSGQQGYLELGFDSREYRSKRISLLFNGIAYVPMEFERRERLGLVTTRGGVEHRVGDRDRPRFIWGGGGGSVLGVEDDFAFGITVDAHATAYLYPTRTTRVGLTLSGGPLWDVSSVNRTSGFSGSGQPTAVHTSFSAAIRLERRLRFRPSLLTD